jgi:pimeloyl-ACP methyl ester carboxylesterase
VKSFVVVLAVAACSSTAATPAPEAPAPPPSSFTPTAFTVKVTGTGRPVIFIPGLASPGSVWDGAVAHLAGSGGHVQAHVLTLAGFAGVPPIQPPFMQQVHDQIVEYIKANHLQHALVVGHSLGGVMSLWLAETDPDIGGIVDVDGFPSLAAVQDPTMTAETAAQVAKGVHDQMAAMTPDQLAAQMKQFLGGMVTKPDDLQRLVDAAAKSDPATIATAFSELIAKDLRPDLAKIAIPVTIVAATDSTVPLDKLQAAWHAQVDAIPHVDLEFVGGAKHFVMLDQPDVFAGVLDKALAK